MGDEFHFGEPARRPARLGRARSGSRRSPVNAGVVWVATGLLLAGVLAFVLLRSADESGRRIAETNVATVDQIDRAQDAAAQGTIGRATVAARGLFAERGTFAVDEADLIGYDPGLSFTTSRSAGPDSVAYAGTDAASGVAVLSESGTCWWARIGANGVTTYGSGEPCTGGAAMAASAPAW